MYSKRNNIDDYNSEKSIISKPMAVDIKKKKKKKKLFLMIKGTLIKENKL
jgi:hypothetical protein